MTKDSPLPADATRSSPAGPHADKAAATPQAGTSANAEAEQFLIDNPDLESVDFLIADINGVLRGKWGPAEAISKVCEPGINLPLSIFGLDIWGREVEATGIHIETGDLDGYCRAVPGRIARAPWSSRPAAQVLLSMYTEDGDPYEIDPRNALQSVVNRFSAKGLTPVVAFELEFYLVDPAAFRSSGRMGKDEGPGPDKQHMYSLSELRGQSDLFAEIRSAALQQGLPIDTIIKEAAPGQFEVNLKHRADPMAAADDTVLLRRAIAECAEKHGLKATFMAKPFLEWPGNGMHVHVSVLDSNGENIFAGSEGDQRLQHAAAGLLSTLKDTLLLYIPSFNGYRRLQAGSYAPTRIAWGRNNRSVVVRVPASDDRARRLEHRMSGADSNPYFVLAGVLGGILEGLETGTMPPPPVEGNAYSVALPQLSDDMDDAIEDFERSDFIRRLFGTDLRRIFAAIKREELAAFDNEITPLERSTYL
ncbi:glutamine synthetase family protein [Pseudohoeflea coraliihabitans]|uniref:Glutamine synthetase family protein n=1 Tax=Pseudohoeflea coraliihabitans TaxID=2860393 RepID=A0ABS6WTL8_9HYPH|nr:glutamine synthetase family protein [Pseudohoeflea sp. DP4N28-3]MBW3098400.1 glutamine synthetase family protein [Pseudohoeflea sp. DP4N28-3]